MGKTIALTRTAAAPPRPRLGVNEELFQTGDCLITCRACGQEERVFIDHPALLCAACLANLGATAQRVAGDYASSMVAFFEAEKSLRERAAGNTWYVKTEAARGDMSITPETFARAWESARLGGGEKSVLIELRDTMDAAALAMQAAELRYIAATPELSAAREAFGEPVEVI